LIHERIGKKLTCRNLVGLKLKKFMTEFVGSCHVIICRSLCRRYSILISLLTDNQDLFTYAGNHCHHIKH